MSEPFIPKFKPPPLRPKTSAPLNVPASFVKRASAWCLDILPFQLLIALFGLGSSSITSPSVGNDGTLNLSLGTLSDVLWSTFEWCILLWVLYALYHIVCEAIFQTTPGKYLVGLKVIRQNTRYLSWSDAILRFLASSLSWITLNAGHAMVHYRKDKAALHDLITHTQVVEDPKITFWNFPRLTPNQHLIALIAGFAIQGLFMLYGTVHLILELNQFAQQAFQAMP